MTKTNSFTATFEVCNLNV